MVIIDATVVWLLHGELQPAGAYRTCPGSSCFLVVGLGIIGFLDDYIKISRQRSLGLNPAKEDDRAGGHRHRLRRVHQFPSQNLRTPASLRISILRDTDIDLAHWGVGIGILLFIVWANFLITAAVENAVNLTDGLDGLATGTSIFVFVAYTVIAVASVQPVVPVPARARRPAAAGPRPPRPRHRHRRLAGACFGFLLVDASPAAIFMGDTGSLALGGALAGLAIMTRTELLVILLGGLFVIITVSVIIQVASFMLTGKRVFRMAPLHHHFELGGWNEVTIVIRFWLIAGLCVALGVGIFYADWVAA